MKNKRIFWSIIVFLVVLISVCGCAEKIEGKLYVSRFYEGNSEDLGFESLEVETAKNDEKYENPDAPRTRTLRWENYVWELEYSYSSPMEYLDYDIDLYTIPEVGDYVWVTFKKDTDQVVRITNLPVDIAFDELNEERYNQLVDSVLSTFVSMPVESMVRYDVTSYTYRGYTEKGTPIVVGNKEKEGFYNGSETDEVTYHTTFFQEKLTDVYVTRKHITIEFSHQNLLLVEIYDVDTDDLKVLAQGKEYDIKENYVKSVKAAVRNKGYQFKEATCDEVIRIYKKDGKKYASFTGRVSYIDGKGEEKKMVAQFAIEYP